MGASTFKNGFRGIRWGQNVNELKNMRLVSRDKKVFSTYTRSGDPLYFGKAKLNTMRYSFWHNKFYEVRMSAAPDQIDKLKTVLNDTYGESDTPYGAHSKIHDYSWTDAGVTIRLSKANFLADCIVTFTSREISSRMK